MRKVLLCLFFLSGVASASQIVNAGPGDMILASTQTITGGKIFTSSITVSTLTWTVISNTTSPVKTANYTMTTADSVIYASATMKIISITLPTAATTLNQFVKILRVDISSGTVKVFTQGSDLIAGTTGAMYLYAAGQGLDLQSDGVSNWWPTGRLPVTPAWIGAPADPNTAQLVSASSNAYCFAYSVPDFVYVTTMSFENGAGSGGMDIGLYDNNGKLLVSSGTFTVPAAGVHLIDFSQKRVVVPPGIVWECLSAGSTATSFNRFGANSTLYGSCVITGTNDPLPATLTFTGCTSAGTREYSTVFGANGGPSL